LVEACSSSSCAQPSQKFGLKARDAREEDQRRRRQQVLQSQKSRRAQLTTSGRDMGNLQTTSDIAAAEKSFHIPGKAAADPSDREGSACAPEVEIEMEPVVGPSHGSDVRMQTDRGAKVRPEVCGALTRAEWMVDIPEDLSSSWYVLARPAGQRCVVRAGGGCTVVTMRGGRTRKFPSALPGGSRVGRTTGRCTLDCIWWDELQTYYVLDVLRWSEHQLGDNPTDLRFWWVRSKLAEARAHVQSSRNPCRFVAPDAYECTAENLKFVYSMPVGYSKDGLLFYHREALYEAGPSPLVLLWGDATCSSRFFDYGSEQMTSALQIEPDKAERWRTDEVAAASSFSHILARISEAMDTALGGVAASAPGTSAVHCHDSDEMMA